MSKKVTLQDRVLQYLQEAGSITSLDAIREFGATRLSAIIFNLKKDGYIIRTESETSKNRWGDKVTYARYFLEDK